MSFTNGPYHANMVLVRTKTLITSFNHCQCGVVVYFNLINLSHAP